MPDTAGDITRMLIAYGAGEREALDSLLPLVYDELRRLAGNYLAGERPDHTLQPTALVHEAYLRLVDQHSVDWQNRAQFFGLAANMMRRILVNYAVARGRSKRGGNAPMVAFNDETAIIPGLDLDVLALDEALTVLEQIDPEKARIVEMKFFAEMTTREIAEVMGCSTATVDRGWAFARGWLFRQMASQNGNDRESV